MTLPETQGQVLAPPEYLSPSSIFTFRQCPLKFKYTRIDKLEDPPGIEAFCGSFVHEILELLYKQPADDRSEGAARQIAASLWPKWRDEAAHLLRTEKQERAFRWQAWWAVENLFKLEDPSTADLVGIEDYVDGEIGGVKVRGVVDRWTRHGDAIVIGDYKTGKTPKPKYRSDKFIQLLIYAILLANREDAEVDRVELLYLKHGDRLEMKPNPDLLCQTEEVVTSTAVGIQNRCDAGEFEPVPSILCDWCAFKTTICPYWNAT